MPLENNRSLSGVYESVLNKVDEGKHISISALLDVGGMENEKFFATITSRLKNNGIEIVDDTASDNYMFSDSDSAVVPSVISSFISIAAKNKPLSHEDEVSLIRKIRACDEEAKDLFVRSNIGLVIRVATYYKRTFRYIPLEDIIQYGNIGLLQAIDKFDPDLGFKFSTYATWWIRQSVGRNLNDYERPVRVPISRIDKMVLVQKYMKVFQREYGRAPTDKEIADEFGYSEHDVTSLCCDIRSYSLGVLPHSLDAPIVEDKDLVLSDVLTNDYNMEEDILHEASMKELIKKIKQRLTDREMYVVEHRFGLNEKERKTFEALGAELGVSRERVRQIEAIALRKIKRIPCLHDYIS